MGKVYALKGDKRRGVARDDSDVYINYNRQELFAMLQQIEYRCRRYVENDDETSTIKPPDRCDIEQRAKREKKA